MPFPSDRSTRPRRAVRQLRGLPRRLHIEQLESRLLLTAEASGVACTIADEDALLNADDKSSRQAIVASLSANVNGSSEKGGTIFANSSETTAVSPVLAQPPNQTLNNNQTLGVTLSVNDPDTPAGSLVYTAGFEDHGYVLQQQNGFGAEVTTVYNWGGQQEKWFRNVSGSTITWYFITPNGNFYRWGGGTQAQLISNSTQLAQLHTVYYTTTTRLSSPTSIAAAAPVNNSSPPAVLTVDPPNTFVGTLRYQVSVSDGSGSDSKTFFAAVNQGTPTSQAPVLSQPANQTLNNNQTLPVTLSVTDPDTPAGSLIYTAAFEDHGFVLQQQNGFGAEVTSTYNWGGQQEKWFRNSSGSTVTWYFITPNGNFYRWGGGTPAQMISNSTLLAQLHTDYYTTTTRLSSPVSIAASAPVNNSSPPAVLTVDPPNTFVGTLRYQVTVSDGSGSDNKTFFAAVNQGGATSQAPVLSQPANQSLDNNQALPVTLFVTDPDTPAGSLIYTAGFEDHGYVLQQQNGFGAEVTSVYNWGGQQEKWFRNSSGSAVTWYFITPNGNFYRWGGGTPAQMISNSTLLAQLHTVYYTTTTRLSSPASIAAAAPINNSAPPAVLTVDPPNTFVGTLRYQVNVSDGTASDTKTFFVTINQPVTQGPPVTQRIASGLSAPTFLTHAPGDSNRVFITLRGGGIRIYDLTTDSLLPANFLTVPGVITTGEHGLLGLAFDPNYQTNGYFYTFQSTAGGAFGNGVTSVVRWTVQGSPATSNVADAASATSILSIDQPQTNHNGGWIGFGPNDGFLYVGVGDGGGSNDTGTGHTAGTGNAQDITDNLLGKMLRIDVHNDAFPADASRNYANPASNPFVGISGDDEIWAYGLRNPFRSSFDRANGNLYIGDVGQGQREEINVQLASSTGGENYGWRLREGMIQTPGTGIGGAKPTGAIDPIYNYEHGTGTLQGNSVTGGLVYRGPITALQGQYFFGDFVNDRIWSLMFNGSAPGTHNGTNYINFVDRTAEFVPNIGVIDNIVAFGDDLAGNLYIVDIGGEIFRLVPGSG